jgi:hypothetical protein
LQPYSTGDGKQDILCKIEGKANSFYDH